MSKLSPKQVEERVKTKTEIFEIKKKRKINETKILFCEKDQ